MKFLLKYFIFAVIILSGINGAQTTQAKIYSASRAIAYIIDNLSERYSMRFRILFFANSTNSRKLVDSISCLISFPVELTYLESIESLGKIDMDKAQIFIQENAENSSYYMIVKKSSIKTNLLTFRKKLVLFYFIDAATNFLKSLIRAFQNNKEFNFNRQPPYDQHFLLHSITNSLDLYNTELFFKGTCKPHFHVINSFNNSKSKWSHDNFLLQYKYFNKCKIVKENQKLPLGADYTIHDRRRNKRKRLYTDVMLRIFASRHKFVMKTETEGVSLMQDYMLARASVQQKEKLL